MQIIENFYRGVIPASCCQTTMQNNNVNLFNYLLKNTTVPKSIADQDRVPFPMKRNFICTIGGVTLSTALAPAATRQ